MKTLFARFAKDESGATAIEYGLIASLIGVAIIVGAGALGSQLNTTFNDIKDELGGGAAAP
jgi:pilus assembly protein Flp/PilA